MSVEKLYYNCRLWDVICEKDAEIVDLCKRTGVGRSVVYKKLRGETQAFHPLTQAKLASGLGVSPCDICDIRP